ncbi:ABC-type lipoprotein export system ATPase subunit [Variovorax boronicumulans]|nr:ABC-type lipoprotein export system ATPase subunit [Variovorax boronicumulans]
MRGVSKTHGGQTAVPVLHGIDLHIGSRELVALVGPSGSGKTSLLNILGLLDRPTSGEYWLDGVSTAEISSAGQRAALRQQKIAFAFQAFHLLPQFTALDNVALPLVYRNAGWRHARRLASERLTQLGLADKQGSYPWQLSAGQQQRVGLARALASSPRLLLADEPTGNLDPVSADAALRLFDDARREQDVSIVLVTHDHGIARRCDRVYRIEHGAIVSATTAPSAASPCLELTAAS